MNKMYPRIAFRVIAPTLVIAVSLAASMSIASERPHWNNIDIIRENVEAPRAHFVAWPDAESAIRGDLAGNPWWQSLNGDWKFHYSDSPAQRPEGFYEPGFNADDWADIPVPSGGFQSR